MEKIKKYLPVSLVTFFVLIAMIAGTLFDFKINNLLFVSRNVFGEIFEVIGKVPGYLILGISGIILFYSRRKDVKWMDILSGVGYGAISYLGFFMTFYSMMENLSLSVWLSCSVILGAVSFVLMLLLFRKVDCKKLAALALTAAITVILTVIAVAILKKIWGRIRYIDILKLDNVALYTPWYSIDPSRGGASFPSGHVSLASCIVLLPLLSEIYPRLQKKKYVLQLIAGMVVVIVAVSRMTFGMHFLTDVTVAFAIPFYLSMIVKKFVIRKNPLTELPDNRFTKLTMLER